MRKIFPVLLAAAAAALPLTLAAPAGAAPPPGGIVLYDAFGTPVAVLRPIAAPANATAHPALAMIRQVEAEFARPPFPADLFAQQDAMLRDVMQRMQSLAASPFPDPGVIEAALGATPGTASQVIVTSFSSGNGTCSETVSYSYPGDGAAPQVAVRKVGDACGAGTMPPMQGVPAAQPVAPAQPTPHVAPEGSRLIQVDYTHPASGAHRLRG